MTAPKLRFKEFDGDWYSHKLENLATFSKGKGVSKADISEDAKNLCIRYGELYTTYGQVINQVVSKTNISKINSVLSKAGDVIIPASGETQIDIATASCVLQSDIILSGDLNILSHSENGEWLAYYLSSTKKLEIAQLAQGNSVVHLYSSQLKDLNINKPSKEEQTKIASFLSQVDEKISQLNQKHELLSQYKQGMMQKLFSQQMRFKSDDGSEFGEWDYVDLGSMSDVTKLAGYEFTKHIVYKDTGRVIALRGLNVKNNKLDLSEVKYIDDSDLNMLSRSKLFIQDLLFTYVGTIGEVALIQENDRFYLAPNVARIRVDKTLLNPYYLLQYFNDHHFKRNEIEKYVATSSQPALSMTNIRKFKIATPSLEEQTKIANFLSAIDQKIEVVARQIEQAKQWKKGLLQQMFV